MKGPMDKLFGHHAFDFDHDGKIDANEWAVINDALFNESDAFSLNCENDKHAIAGLDLEDTKFMDEEAELDSDYFENEI